VYTEWRFMNNYGFEMRGEWMSEEHNYDETRVDGRYLYKPQGYNFNIFAHTDWSKKLSGYVYYGGFERPDRDQSGNWMGIGLEWNIGQKLALDYELSHSPENNDYGYVSNSGDTIIHIAQRDLNTIENVLEMAYTFNNKLSLRLRGRHYWSGAENKAFYLLQDDGTLIEDPDYDDNHDRNFNSFNVDMVLRWVFAPGSEMTLGWKNSVFAQDDRMVKDYNDNMEIIRDSPQINTVSFKVLYYIDYNTLFKNRI
ncbi:MAG: DUF5916 domain-containing protein, partial [Bacteroidales bacterium]|nr:DUF5916 domain-containing protein [Bacteroidales bacterium]